VATSTSSGEDSMFSTVSMARVSQAIVDQIKSLIREGTLQPGDQLPSERELCQRFGVSRVTVREALRVLEAGGLIMIKVGSRGGAFVTTPTSAQVGSGLADLVNLSPITSEEVTEARKIFELGIVPLVIERVTDDDIAELRELVAKHGDLWKQGSYSMELSAAFHAAVARCTHNAAILALVQSFHGPLLMSLLEAQTVAPWMGKVGVTEHAALVDAIAARDQERAEKIMRTHLNRTEKRLKSTKK
jgi:GntR family transcriptional regulator, transcriptional repressor for pyruvate dehydrogenase complex